MSLSRQIELVELDRLGRDLARPENVLCFRDGTVLASSNQGYVSVIDPSGGQRRIPAAPGSAPTTMALESEEALIVNDTTDGKLHRLRLDGGGYEPFLEEIDGSPLGSANYVFRDTRNRYWIAVATRHQPPHESIEVVADGYIAVIEDGRGRIVADGLRWPNEIRLDAREEYAYVSETLGKRVLRYPVLVGGDLGEPAPVGPDPLGPGAFPDGFALDREGNVWVTIVSRNGLMVIEPDGSASTVFEQPLDEPLAELEAAFAAGSIPMATVAACAGPDIKLPTSVGFAGPELRTMVLGSLAMDQLITLPAPVPGLPLAHQYGDKASPILAGGE